MGEITNINWRTMPAGFMLDKLIAERLGYRFEWVTLPEDHGFRPQGWFCYKPDGGQDNKFFMPTILDAIAVAGLRVSLMLNETSLHLGPCLVWHGSKGDGDDLYYASFEYSAYNGWTIYADISSESQVESGETEALARCRAWLAWKEKNNV